MHQLPDGLAEHPDTIRTPIQFVTRVWTTTLLWEIKETGSLYKRCASIRRVLCVTVPAIVMRVPRDATICGTGSGIVWWQSTTNGRAARFNIRRRAKAKNGATTAEGSI